MNKVLIFDIETAGVQGLCADRGFCVVFGYMWLGEKTAHAITIKDFPGKDVHDDTQLLKRAVEIINQADGLVAHYGEKFDKPYLQARLLRAGLPPIANNKLTDTCLFARAHLKLSSNRLGNIADFLELPNRKMDKRGGWPTWWTQALRGDAKAIAAMADYCKKDVLCLRDIYLRLRHLIPTAHLPANEAIGEKIWACPSCGGFRKQDRGTYLTASRRFQRYQCMSCGRWDRSKKPIAVLAKA